MNIFSNLFRSGNQSEKADEKPQKPQVAPLTNDDIPNAPPLTASIEERCRRDDMVSRGYNFVITSDLTFIDDNGNCIHL